MSEAGRIVKDVARGVVRGTVDSLPHVSAAVNQAKTLRNAIHNMNEAEERKKASALLGVDVTKRRK